MRLLEWKYKNDAPYVWNANSATLLYENKWIFFVLLPLIFPCILSLATFFVGPFPVFLCVLYSRSFHSCSEFVPSWTKDCSSGNPQSISASTLFLQIKVTYLIIVFASPCLKKGALSLCAFLWSMRFFCWYRFSLEKGKKKSDIYTILFKYDLQSVINNSISCVGFTQTQIPL